MSEKLERKRNRLVTNLLHKGAAGLSGDFCDVALPALSPLPVGGKFWRGRYSKSHNQRHFVGLHNFSGLRPSVSFLA